MVFWTQELGKLSSLTKLGGKSFLARSCLFCGWKLEESHCRPKIREMAILGKNQAKLAVFDEWRHLFLPLIRTFLSKSSSSWSVAIKTETGSPLNAAWSSKTASWSHFWQNWNVFRFEYTAVFRGDHVIFRKIPITNFRTPKNFGKLPKKIFKN